MSPTRILDENSLQAQAAKRKIAELRQRLLDLSNRNRLLNFKHSPRGAKYVRIVDETPKRILELIESASAFDLAPLPAPPDEPEDEHTPEFVTGFKEALLTDKVFLREAAEIN